MFGTDGNRGTVNEDKVTALMAVNLAMAAGEYFYGKAGTKKSRVLIGKDTRLSGYTLEPALAKTVANPDGTVTVEEFLKVISFFVSSESSWIKGQDIMIDGRTPAMFSKNFSPYTRFAHEILFS